MFNQPQLFTRSLSHTYTVAHVSHLGYRTFQSRGRPDLQAWYTFSHLLFLSPSGGRFSDTVPPNQSSGGLQESHNRFMTGNLAEVTEIPDGQFLVQPSVHNSHPCPPHTTGILHTSNQTLNSKDRAVSYGLLFLLGSSAQC